jgi:hypothetical protein
MSWRVTFALAVALIATALYAWFDLQHGGSSPMYSAGGPAATPVGTKAKPLAEFALQDVEAIRLQRGALRLQVRRANGLWTGVQRPDIVNDFLSSLHDMSEIMEVEASQKDLADYGLDAPADSIELLLREGEPINLFVGSPNPAGTGVYLRIGRGGRVVLAGALLRWEVDKLTRALTEPASGNTTPSPEF